MVRVLRGVHTESLPARQKAQPRYYAVLPAGWWDYLAAATYAPNDDLFRFTLSPLSIDYGLMSRAELDQFQFSLISSIGVFNSLEVREIFTDAGLL